MKSQPVIVRARCSDRVDDDAIGRQTTTLEIEFSDGKHMHIVFDGSETDVDPWFFLDIISISTMK